MVSFSSSAVYFSSNEDGLSPEDVVGMCDLGASTKLYQNGDSIGHKGLGFKSVFRLSAEPHVSSGAYCFKFDTSLHGDIGMLVPIWVQQDHFDSVFNGSADQDCARTGLRILLPLRPEVTTSALAVLKGHLNPVVLLLLRRVKRIVLTSEDGRSTTLESGRLESEGNDNQQCNQSKKQRHRRPKIVRNRDQGQ